MNCNCELCRFIRERPGIEVPAPSERPLLRDFTGSTEDALRMALRMLHDDTADYIKRNNLGGMDNHVMRLAREALALPSPAPSEREALRQAALRDCDGLEDLANLIEPAGFKTMAPVLRIMAGRIRAALSTPSMSQIAERVGGKHSILECPFCIRVIHFRFNES